MYDLDAHIIDHEILGIHAGSGGGVSGTGTTNTIPMWTNGPGGVLGDSRITDDGTNIGISDATKFYVGRFSTSGLSADQLFTFPDSSGTIAVGAGTTYNIPFYTNGAEATLGDGPLSYDGSVFVNSIQPIKTIYGTEKSDIKPWTHVSSFMRVTRRARKRMREERRVAG